MGAPGRDEHCLSNILSNDIWMHGVLAGKLVQHRRSQKIFLVVYRISPGMARLFLVEIRANVASVIWRKDMPQGVPGRAIQSLPCVDEQVHSIGHVEMQSRRSCMRLVKRRRESVVHLRSWVGRFSVCTAADVSETHPGQA